MRSNWYNSKISESTEESNDVDSASSYTDAKFRFPTPPRLSKSLSVSPFSANYRSASDSSVSTNNRLNKTKRKKKLKYIKALPPIGIFWDIENCQVPKAKSAALVVQQIRELFYNDYREAEFLVVCDVKKESSQIVSDLNDAQVNLIHVSSKSKNAADEKLRQSLRRFSELHKIPAAVALISGDVNFAADLSDLRYRKKMHVILLHNNNVADALILCANETYNFVSIIEQIPSESKFKSATNQQTDIFVFNLPIISSSDVGRLKNRLKHLSDNCGGRVLSIHKDSGHAVIRFSSLDFAKRAQKRLDGEYIFGNKIQVSQPTFVREKLKSTSGFAVRKIRTEDTSQQAIAYLDNAERNVLESLQSPTYEIAFPSYISSSELNQKIFLNGNRSGRSVELIIANLDSSIDRKKLYNDLVSKLNQFVTVVDVSINVQSDGVSIALVKVANQQEAQLLISHLNNQKLGKKRITVSYIQTKFDLDQLQSITIALLQEAPNNSMPLFKFLELAASRYHCNISLADITKLKGICKIGETREGRIIYLMPEANTLPINTESFQDLYLYCLYHCPNGLDGIGLGEATDISLPNITIDLKLFETQVNKLLASHSGHLPLLSFSVCYAFEFGSFPEDECGVPLEHLVTAIPNIVLTCNGHNKNVKYLELRGVEEAFSSPSSLTPNLSAFSREVVDVLKTVDNCQLLMRRFISTYHQHFGRQCRVADYGFTRLADLFEAISHVVQILGYGGKRIITLTHSSQIKRFISDLQRLLKGQTSKKVTIVNFCLVYEKTFGKKFHPVEYGLCSLEDLLSQLPEGIVKITQIDITIPMREQTAKELKKTNKFSLEVKQLLTHSPYCSLLFNKFIPTYHQHFGRQCKVSDYGFTKLADLFEAIAHTVDLEGFSDVDRRIKLKLPLALDVLGEQIQLLLKESSTPFVSVEDVFSLFAQRYGYTLKPEVYECKDVTDLVFKLSSFVRIVHSSAGTQLAVRDLDVQTLEIRVWSLLVTPPYTCSLRKFIFDYRVKFFGTLPITKLEQVDKVVAMVNNGTETILFLTPLYILAARLYHLLFVNEGFILLCDISNIYYKKYGIPLSPSDYGINTFEDLLWQISFAVTIKGGGKQLYVVLNKDLAEHGVELPPAILEDHYSENRDYYDWPSSITNLSYKNFSPLKCNSTKDDCNVGSANSYSNQLNAVIPKISSPHPTDLPTPDKLLSQSAL